MRVNPPLPVGTLIRKGKRDWSFLSTFAVFWYPNYTQDLELVSKLTV